VWCALSWKALQENFRQSSETGNLVKEDIELLEGNSSKILSVIDNSSEVPIIRRWSEN
jgi:hypothetical protein